MGTVARHNCWEIRPCGGHTVPFVCRVVPHAALQSAFSEVQSKLAGLEVRPPELVWQLCLAQVGAQFPQPSTATSGTMTPSLRRRAASVGGEGMRTCAWQPLERSHLDIIAAVPASVRTRRILRKHQTRPRNADATLEPTAGHRPRSLSVHTAGRTAG